jgi:hypothetical protein
MEELLFLLKTTETPPIDGQNLASTMEYGDGIRRRTVGLRLITDDNMGDEWTPPGQIPGNIPPQLKSQANPQR